MANKPAPKARGPRSLLVALVGAIAAIGLATTIPADESGREVRASVTAADELRIEHVAGAEHRTAYRDIVGVLTICDGDTANVLPGMVETREGCQRRLERQLLAHAEPVMRCIPTLAQPGRDYQRWAVISHAYNFGTGATCTSTMAARMRVGRWVEGCDQLPRWNRAGGQVVRGLTLRRQREREICLTGLTTDRTPANLPARIARWRA